jgi:polysaccharide pyruvyl transferase WcaK-like protein
VSALCDIVLARELGMPVVLASHSIGPLDAGGLRAVSMASLRVAREPATHRYLHEHGVCAVQSADLAFLYPYERVAGPSPLDDSYRLVFLRSNNLHAGRLRLDRGTLYDGPRRIAQTTGERIVLATTDYRRDGRFLAHAARSLRVPSVTCRSVAELVRVIEGSSGVVSDRYHPAICAAVLGKPAQVIPNREPHKMTGLQDLLAGSSLEELRALARAGLDAVRGALRTAA